MTQINSAHWGEVWDNHVVDGRVKVPCYHPAVSYGGVLDQEVTRELFLDPMRCFLSNPMNVDAAVQLQRAHDAFVEKNNRLLDDYNQGECPVCFESFTDDKRDVVYQCHVLHVHCVATTKACPVCRGRWLFKMPPPQ